MTENKVFTLHHRVNFFVIVAGIVCLVASNYLNGNAIVCKDGSDFTKSYCWLHGGRHVARILQRDACRTDKTGDDYKSISSYYIWLPYVLIICAGIVKAPRFIWKTIGERGTMETIVEQKDTMDKMADRFHRKIRGRRAKHYCLSFLFCQFLNFMSVVAIFLIINALLDGQFLNYGPGTISFWQRETNENPMCDVFPTEVSCDVSFGAATGGKDKDNHICVLSNNMFNKYYFLILWFWWTALLIISGFAFIYDLIKCMVPGFGNSVFYYSLIPYDLEDEANRLRGILSSHDIYVLVRITQNLKGSEIENFLRELTKLNVNTASKSSEKNAMVDMERLTEEQHAALT